MHNFEQQMLHTSLLEYALVSSSFRRNTFFLEGQHWKTKLEEYQHVQSNPPAAQKKVNDL